MERESGISKTARPSKALGKADGFGKGQDSDGFGKGQESVLGNKLLFLWARGQLSATLVRELADCAIADGAQHSDLVAIAQCGNWGAQPGNVHRQMMNAFCSHVQIASSFDVDVPCLRPKTSKDALEKASIFLPHCVFSTLGENYPEVFAQLIVLLWKRQFGQLLEKSCQDRRFEIERSSHVFGKGLGRPHHPLVYTWGWCGIFQQWQSPCL